MLKYRSALLCRAPLGRLSITITVRGIHRMHGKPPPQVAAAIKEDVLAMVDGLGLRPRDIRDQAVLLIRFSGAFG